MFWKILPENAVVLVILSLNLHSIIWCFQSYIIISNLLFFKINRVIVYFLLSSTLISYLFSFAITNFLFEI